MKIGCYVRTIYALTHVYIKYMVGTYIRFDHPRGGHISRLLCLRVSCRISPYTLSHCSLPFKPLLKDISNLLHLLVTSYYSNLLSYSIKIKLATKCNNVVKIKYFLIYLKSMLETVNSLHRLTGTHFFCYFLTLFIINTLEISKEMSSILPVVSE